MNDVQLPEPKPVPEHLRSALYAASREELNLILDVLVTNYGFTGFDCVNLEFIHRYLSEEAMPAVKKTNPFDPSALDAKFSTALPAGFKFPVAHDDEQAACKLLLAELIGEARKHPELTVQAVTAFNAIEEAYSLQLLRPWKKNVEEMLPKLLDLHVIVESNDLDALKDDVAKAQKDEEQARKKFEAAKAELAKASSRCDQITKQMTEVNAAKHELQSKLADRFVNVAFEAAKPAKP